MMFSKLQFEEKLIATSLLFI